MGFILDDFACDSCGHRDEYLHERGILPNCPLCQQVLTKQITAPHRHGSWDTAVSRWSKYEKKNVENGFGPGGDVNWEHPRWENESPADHKLGRMGSGEKVGIEGAVDRAIKKKGMS